MPGYNRDNNEDRESRDSRNRRDNRDKYFDYRNVKQLQRYTNIYGQIEPRSKTGLSEKQQRQLACAIKRARHLALLPFIA